MKYCLKCDSEYLNEIQVCADCGEPLVWEEEYRKKKEQKELKKEHLNRLKFVPVKYVENAIVLSFLLFVIPGFLSLLLFVIPAEAGI